ncbi:MAG TPA: hypothetical protein VII69_12165 [Candidatus Eremiobacteraceae bacterium]
MMFHLRIAATIILCFAGSVLASAPPAMASPSPKPAASAEKESFSFNGTVSKVNYAANVVEMNANGRRVSIALEPTTAIDVAGEPGSVSDIRPGVEIHAEGVIRKGIYIAQTIAIHGAAKRKSH